MATARHAVRRRLLGAAALVAGLVLVLPHGASGADTTNGGVLVTVGARTTYLSPEELVRSEDVPGTTYQVREPSNPTEVRYHGVSASLLATLAGVPPENVVSMTVTKPGDSPETVTRDQLVSGYPGDGDKPAIFFSSSSVGGSSSTFFRPLRTTDDTTTATLKSANDTNLLVTVVPDEALVDVDVTAQPGPGTSVALKAGSPGLQDGDIASVRWAFGDGATGTGVSTTHDYATAGTYQVRATITTDDGRSGVGTTQVQAGDSGASTTPTDATPQPGGGGPGGTGSSGTGTAGAPATGPDAAGGQTAGGTPTTPTTPAAPQPTTPGPTATATPPSRRRGSDRAAKPVPAAPSSSSTPDGSSAPSSNEAGPASTAAVAPARTSPRRVDRTRRTGAATRSTAGRISGVLVSARTAAAVTPLSSVAEAAAARRGSDPRGTSDLAWILGPLAVLALLGLGAARELRPRRSTLRRTGTPTA